METYVTVDRMLMTYLVYALILLRCSGLMVFAPFFGADNFPQRARILLGAFIAICMVPFAAPLAQLHSPMEMSHLAMLALQELSIGLILGFLASMVFMGVQLAGQLMGQQVGFAMANVVDPMTDRDISIIGFLKMNMTIMIFLALNLHLGMLYVLRLSFTNYPVGCALSAVLIGKLNYAAGEQAQAMFIVAVQMATPVLLIMLLNSVVVGFVTRTMPQMNIMVFGLPMRVALGVTVLMLVIPIFGEAIGGVLEESVLDLKDTVTPSAVWNER